MFKNLGPAFNFYVPACFLTAIGLVTIYSIKPDVAMTQLVFFAVSLIAGFLINKLQLSHGWLPAKFWYALVLISLLATAVTGNASRGSARWLTIFGQQFQTSEFAKIGLILFASTWFSKKSAHTFVETFRFLLYLFIPAFLIFRQPDLGTALMIAAIGVSALLASGTPLKNLVTLALATLIITPPLLLTLKPYQQARLDTFINPQVDPLGQGYNVTQATIAVGSGKLIGRGLGQGTQSHLRFLPERHTDFIFASLVEEMGFFGGTVVILLYLWLCFSLIQSSREAATLTESLVRLILAGLILFQTFVNIGMNMGITPITGVTLPFVSYGGSSLLSLYILLGIAVGNMSSPKNQTQLFHIR